MSILVVDHEIIRWIWPPLWKSIVRALSNRGGAKVGVILLARHADPSFLTSLLLSLRLLETLDDLSAAPMVSNVPRFGRLLGAGRVSEFRAGVLRAFTLYPLVYLIGVCLIAFLGPIALQLVGSEVSLLPVSLFFILVILYMLNAEIRLSLMIKVNLNNLV